MEPGESPPPRRGRIVVGTDGSQASVAAVRWAIDAAAATGARIDVVLVWSAVIDFGWLGAPPVHGWQAQPSTEAHRLLDALLDEVCGGVQPPALRTFVIEGDPAQCLVSHSAGADVLVLADRGAGGFLGLRLGSVVSACAAYASCPVLIVPSARTGRTLGLAPPAVRHLPDPPALLASGASR